MGAEADRRLRDIAMRIPRPDPTLAHLIRVSTRPSTSGLMQTGLVVCVGAFMFRGIPAPATRMTEILDEHMNWFIRVNQAVSVKEGGDGAAWDRTLELTKGFFTDPLLKVDAEEEAFSDELEARDITLEDLMDIPDDLVRTGVIALSPRVTMTLEDAQMLGPSGAGWEDVGVVRIKLADVGAWWPFKLSAPPEVADELE